jgi:hypothetical protein
LLKTRKTTSSILGAPPHQDLLAERRTNWPVLRSSSLNAPEPTAFFSLSKVETSFSSMFFQMCSGRIGTASRSMDGLGFLVVITRVVSSGAVTLLMLAT